MDNKFKEKTILEKMAKIKEIEWNNGFIPMLEFMIKFIGIIAVIGAIGFTIHSACQEDNKTEAQREMKEIEVKHFKTSHRTYEIEVIDGCEYLVNERSHVYTHKGNCTNVVHKID